MILKPASFASAAAIAAALSMASTPAAAAEMPAIDAPAGAYLAVNTGDAGEANQYRRYRGHRDRDRGIDAGDVVAGVVVLGALAAIIGSSNNNRDRDERRERVRYDQQRDRNYDSRGVEGAVDMCIDEVEYRDRRVDNVDQAQRSANGWNVSGTLSDGESWTCFIDNSGEIRNIEYGTGTFSQAPTGAAAPQLSDADYRNARAATRTAVDGSYRYDDAMPVASGPDSVQTTVPRADGPRPAYPGGPLPGEEGYDDEWEPESDADESEWEGDGRYTTAQTPDFEQSAR